MKGSTWQLLGYPVAWGSYMEWRLQNAALRWHGKARWSGRLLGWWFISTKSRVNSFSWVPCNILWSHTPSLVNSWVFSLIEKSVWLNPASIFLCSLYSHAFWDPWKRIELNQDFWNYFTFPHDLLHQQAHLSYGKASVPSFLSVPNEERIMSQLNSNPAAVQQVAAMLLNYWINRFIMSVQH